MWTPFLTGNMATTFSVFFPKSSSKQCWCREKCDVSLEICDCRGVLGAAASCLCSVIPGTDSRALWLSQARDIWQAWLPSRGSGGTGQMSLAQIVHCRVQLIQAFLLLGAIYYRWRWCKATCSSLFYLCHRAAMPCVGKGHPWEK